MTHLCLLISMALIDAVSLRGEVTFRPSTAESEVPERFRLDAATFGYEMEQRLSTEHYRMWSVRFPSPIETPDATNNVVFAEYFEPTNIPPGTRCPAVVVLHILGADFALSRYMAARLADAGVAALFVKLPYYGER